MLPIERWQSYLKSLVAFEEITLVGPFASPRKEWPKPCIFIDSGSRHKTADPTHFSVGDGDSSTEELDYLLPTEKDFSDLAFVLKALPIHLRRLSMVGFLGGRRDHELINFGEVHHFLKTRVRQTECDLDWSVCAFSAGDWVLDFKGLFSLVAFEPVQVQMTGDCRYSLIQPTHLEPLSSHGLSNEANGKIVLVLGGPAFIFKNPFS